MAAPFLSHAFFPEGDPTVALIQTYALFAIGFLIRPVGAMILGPMGDKHGRNKILALSIVLMALGTGLIGFVPTYERIGILAPIIVLLLRLVQGFAAGGEWGAATAFLYEFAPADKKAFFGSFRPTGTGLGFFLGSFIMSLTVTLMDPDFLYSFGWRFPFFLALVLGGVGLYIRLQVDETPVFKEALAKNDIAEKPLTEMFELSKKAIAVMFAMVLIWNAVYYIIFTYMPTYLKVTLNVSQATAMQTNTIVTAFYTCLIPLIGWLSDRYSKKMFLMISCLGFVIVGIPAYMLLDPTSYLNLLVIQLLLVTFMAFFSGPATAVISELFPARVRNTAVSVTYTFNVALFGGTAPMVCVWLTSVTGNPIAPAFYMVFCSLISLWGVLQIKEKNGVLQVVEKKVS
ncbi:MAG: MFS transporter [Syntrophomonadaceae bacterium]